MVHLPCCRIVEKMIRILEAVGPGGERDMRRINPDYRAIACRMANESPYFKLLSMELKEFEVGESLLEIRLENKHLQPFGFVHGGVFASIIDAAAFWAVFPDVGEEEGMTTVDLSLNYLAPAVTGTLIARGRRIKMGRTLGLGEAQVLDRDGRILTHGTSTLVAVPGGFGREQPMPPKFLDD